MQNHVMRVRLRQWPHQRLALTAVMIAVAAGCSPSQNDEVEGTPAQTATVTTAGTAPSPTDDAIAVVASALDAKNSLDLDRWLMAHEGGSRKGVPLFAEEILMNANQQWEVIEACRVTGQNDAGATVVRCLIINTDDFWGVGEIYEPRELQFPVNSHGEITTDDGVTNANTFRSSRRNSFNYDFHLWLSVTHPDVYDEMDTGSISRSGPGFATQNPDHMLIAVDYVQEFVAQSDDYPLEPTNS